MAKVLRARDILWDEASTQHGFFAAQQARDLGISKIAVQKLIERGALERHAHGVYRFPMFPVSMYDPYSLAVLWTGVGEACLSHESALDAYGISDINPNVIHLTVNRHRRIRRQGGEKYVIHYEDLTPDQIGWWQEIPTVTVVTAIEQCITHGTPTYLLRQALERGSELGYLTTIQQEFLGQKLEERHVR